MDSLLSIVQMPGGVPVGTLAIGAAGAQCRLLAALILALGDEALAGRLAAWRRQQTGRSRNAIMTQNGMTQGGMTRMAASADLSGSAS